METGDIVIWSCGIEMKLLIILLLEISLLCCSRGQFKLFSIDVTIEVLVKSLYTNLADRH